LNPSGVKDIKLLGRERAYIERFIGPSHRLADALTRSQILSEMPTHVIHGVAFGGVVLLCVTLLEPASFLQGDALAKILPILGVFAFAGQRMMPELGKLYGSVAVLQTGMAAVESIYADLNGPSINLPHEIPNALGLREALQLDAITYRYPKADYAGLTDVTLTIKAGEKIGIIGGTGAGKTTLADIILGLLRPHTGRLIVDGTPVVETNLRDWQQSVGYVAQDIFLIDASVAQNIALGIPLEQIDMDQVIRAARIASIDTFISDHLPGGYEAAIGERGVRLSGGQRQRIGIARALYHDANLIVFDEATSALDNLTEAEVMAAIEALPGDKTIIMIAHRLSTVKRCDRIVVMENGRMVGCDRWDALMTDNQIFRRIAVLDDNHD